MDSLSLKNKTAIVTGSSRGIGRAIAIAYARAGARVVITSRKADACAAVVDQIRSEGLEATAIACNISRKDEVLGLVDQTEKVYGTVDVLVCNAAVNPYYGPMSGISDEAFSKVMDVNIRSNLSLFRSRVDQIPGPHNTLDQQPRGTANLGFDYRLRSLPLTLGGNLNYTPAYEIQQTELQLTSLDRKRVADAFALWTISPDLGLRLSAANLAPLDYVTGSVITTDKAVITSRSGGPSYTQWQLRLEMKL